MATRVIRLVCTRRHLRMMERRYASRSMYPATSNRDRSRRVSQSGNYIFTSANNEPVYARVPPDARSHAHVRIILIAVETPMYHSRKFYCAYRGDRSLLVPRLLSCALLLSLPQHRNEMSILFERPSTLRDDTAATLFAYSKEAATYRATMLNTCFLLCSRTLEALPVCGNCRLLGWLTR